MPKVITFDKGSKRKLRKIRWKLAEVLSLALLSALLFAASFLVFLAELHEEHRHHEPGKGHQLNDPTRP